MYVPKHYQAPDEATLLAFMQRYSFATLVTAPGGQPVANHLPFVVSKPAQGPLVLTSHMARANSQWQHLAGHPALVIFTEPHAYISPRHYEQAVNVPTWNYIAVHATATARLLPNAAEQYQVLEDMIAAYEPEYLAQWRELPATYKERMRQAIVPFELHVTDLQAKFKLSQNRSEQERHTIAAALGQSPADVERQLAGYMS
jgi:transcriptional regulator